MRSMTMVVGLALRGVVIGLTACSHVASVGGDAGTDADTGTDTDGWEGILCGWGICDLPQVCCITSAEPYQECVDSDSCAGDLMVACDGPEDCGATGGECCLPSGAYSATYCVTGECMSTQAVCHVESDCSEGESCCPGVLFGWTYSACQADPCD